MFSDIVGFTIISETMKPQRLVGFLNQYMTHMVEAIESAGGLLLMICSVPVPSLLYRIRPYLSRLERPPCSWATEFFGACSGVTGWKQ